MSEFLDTKGITTQSLEELVELWQERLNLPDWTISIKFVSLEKMENKDADAEVDLHPTHKVAYIYVAPPGAHDTPTNKVVNRDIELTIVHEMLHILLWAWDDVPPETVEEMVLEQTINTLAATLMKGHGRSNIVPASY